MTKQPKKLSTRDLIEKLCELTNVDKVIDCTKIQIQISIGLRLNKYCIHYKLRGFVL